MSDQKRAKLEPSERDRGIYRERGDLPEISCIYLYYIVPDDFESSRVYCYWKDEPIRDYRSRIRSLIKNAHENRKEPSPCSQYLSDIIMRRVSYVVFVTEGRALDRHHPISVRNAPDDTASDHTFSNARCEDIRVRIGDNDVLFTAAVVVNLLRKYGHEEWQHGDHEKFEFSCFDDGKNNIFPHAGHYHHRSRHEHESGGTNMGPPVPPP